MIRYFLPAALLLSACQYDYNISKTDGTSDEDIPQDTAIEASDTDTVPCEERTWHRDNDGDGFGAVSSDSAVKACEQPEGYVANNTDCDDANASAYPGAPDGCDGVDQNCDDMDGNASGITTWYLDADSDGYGDPDTMVTDVACPGAGYNSQAGDCDETNDAVNPSAEEVCNGTDDDCDEAIDEGLADCGETPEECNGFLVNQPLGNPDVETDSFAIFSLVGDSEIEVRQGETAKLPFTVTADSCGDIVLTGFTVVLSVIDYTPAEWVTDVEHSGEDSTVENVTGEAQFEPIDGYNSNADGYDQQLFYTWDTEVYNPNTQGAMDEVYVEAATTQILEFSFTATEYVEPGISFDLYLVDPFWVDVGTGSEVWDGIYYSPNWEEHAVWVRVTITE